MADGLDQLLRSCSLGAFELQQSLHQLRSLAQDGNWNEVRREYLATSMLFLGEAMACQTADRQKIVGLAEGVGKAVENEDLGALKNALRRIESEMPGLNTSF
jgi:hypothetical protein